MGLAKMSDILENARAGGYAVGCYNALNMEMIRGVIAAAEAENAPVILCHAEVHFKYTPLESIAPVLISEAGRASVPVALLLDHGNSFEACVRAMQLGFGAVMYDGSELPYEQNLENTAQMVRIANAMGAEVEAELGHVTRPKGGGTGAGDAEEGSADDVDLYTDPVQAGVFAKETGVAALAVAFGTAHGVYAKTPVLDFGRLDEIGKRVDVPLVMHGGSGLTAGAFRRAIDGGVAKINYYTGMARYAGGVIRDKYGKIDGDVFYHDMMMDAVRAIECDCRASMQWFGCSGKAQA